MTPQPTTPASARDIILEIIRNMREGAEPLHSCVLAPSVYRVYLHPNDLDRLRGIIPRIVEEARTALAAEVEKVNRTTLADRLGISRARAVMEAPSTDCTIELLENTEPDTQPGDIVIHSELALPAKAEYAGSLTRRIATRRLGESRVSTTEDAGRPVPETYATLEYED